MVEYLLQTPIGLRVAELIRGVRPIAPEMLDAEVVSALRSMTIRGEIGEERALIALDALARSPVERVSHQGLARSTWQFGTTSAPMTLFTSSSPSNRTPR